MSRWAYGVMVTMLVLGGLLLASCGGDTTTQTGGASSEDRPKGGELTSDWDAVVEAAKEEGEVVVYCGCQDPVVQQMKSAFESEYGIRVELLEGRPTEVQERIRTEQTAGRFIGDVSHNGWSASLLLREAGYLQPHGSLPNLDKLVDFESDGTLVPIYVGTNSIAINTNLVRPEDEPRSWRDLADPKWRGKILADTPWAGGSGGTWFVLTYRTFGRQFHEQMAQQEIVFNRNFADMLMQVARGEYAMLFPVPTVLIKNVADLPVKFIHPEAEGAPYAPFVAAVLKGAPHPNAARLWINYYLTENIQQILAQNALRPVIEIDWSSVPPDIRKLLTSKLWGAVNPQDLDSLMPVAEEIYSSR